MKAARSRHVNAVAPATVALAATVLAAASAHAASVKEIFEGHKLIGTFSYDCTKPADKKNFYYVDRVIDADHVQRDQMSGPTTRDFALMIDKAEELNPNEVKISGKHAEDGLAVESIWRIEPNRMLQWQSTQNGKPVIRDGVFLGTQYKMPYLNRCGD